MAYQLQIYYEVWTEEDREIGETNNQGEHFVERFDETEMAGDSPAEYVADLMSDLGPWVWEGEWWTSQPEEDYGTGADTIYTAHVEGFSPSDMEELHGLLGTNAREASLSAFITELDVMAEALEEMTTESHDERLAQLSLGAEIIAYSLVEGDFDYLRSEHETVAKVLHGLGESSDFDFIRAYNRVMASNDGDWVYGGECLSADDEIDAMSVSVINDLRDTEFVANTTLKPGTLVIQRDRYKGPEGYSVVYTDRSRSTGGFLVSDYDLDNLFGLVEYEWNATNGELREA